VRFADRSRKVTLFNEIEVSPGFLPGRAECGHREHFRHDDDGAGHFATHSRSGVLHSLGRSVPRDPALSTGEIRSYRPHYDHHDYYNDNHYYHVSYFNDHVDSTHVDLNIDDDNDRSCNNYDDKASHDGCPDQARRGLLCLALSITTDNSSRAVASGDE
jgi:hypothetical protein